MIIKAIAIFLLLGTMQSLHAQDTAPADTTIITTDSEEVSSHVEPLPVLRKVPDSIVKNMKQDKDFEYANDPSYWVHHKEETVQQSDSWDGIYKFFSYEPIKWLAWITVGLLFIFILYRVIISNNLYVFHSSKKMNIGGEEAEEELDQNKIDDKIRNAIQLGNYREAVRYYYLKTLYILGDKGWIQLHAQSTNYEYVLQMNKHSLAGKFNYLTNAFEFVWYGEFNLSENQFALVQNAFQNFYNNVKA